MTEVCGSTMGRGGLKTVRGFFPQGPGLRETLSGYTVVTVEAGSGKRFNRISSSGNSKCFLLSSFFSFLFKEFFFQRFIFIFRENESRLGRGRETERF